MSEIEEFLTPNDEQEIVAAIKTAEKNTSGEIRVHIETTAKIDPYERAKEVFFLLEMDKTKDQNAVLIYVAVHEHKFVICGDKAINEVVPNEFWESTKNIMQAHFKQGNFKKGLIDGILKAGEELKAHFPWQVDDENELSNQISKG